MVSTIIPILIRILVLTPIFADDDPEDYEYFDLSECVEHGSSCDPKLKYPCCEPFAICALYDWSDEYFCLGNGTLQEYCKEDIDCLPHNSVCSKNKCVCDQNFIRLNDTACGPLTNGYCDVDEQCVPKNSHCTNKVCLCKPGFTLVSNQECAPTYTGKSCNTDQDCLDVNRATCSKSKKCICRENSFARSNNDVCLSLIEGYCTQDSDCVLLNSICVNNQCQCKMMFIAVSNRECKLSYLGQNCDKDQDCIDTDLARCSEDKKCVCRENHTSFDDAICVSLVGGYCWRHEDCLPDNTVCVADRCQCKTHFELRSNDHCVRKLLGQTCRINADCEDIKHAKCAEDYVCVCKKNHFAIDDTTCGSLLNGYCIENKECEVQNSICVNQKCQCKLGFIQESKFRCISASLSKICNTDEDCGNTWRSECSNNKTCVCKTNHTVIDGLKCAPLIGEFCTDSEDCAPHHSVCFKSRCECQSGFVAQFNTECVPALLGRPCEMDIDCREVKHAKCSKDNVCICREHNTAVNNSTCEPLLGSFCWKNEKCAPDNSICIKDQCRCKSTFVPQSRSQCVKLPLGHSCETNDDCIATDYLKCSRQKKCVCTSSYIEENQRNCRPLLNGICFDDEDCLPDHSECINRICRCQKNFVPVSNDQCIAVEPPKPCHVNRDCKEVRYSRCNKYNECECRIHYEERNRTCMPILKQSCIKGDICFPNHSHCVNGLCECVDGFAPHLNNLCLPTN